mmetsp:Transcript_95654/g.309872  ORF Transcript_95654/g.309872 Transcript_95654/m.309872 type:complete len:210 (+) Transcript_95654:5911-6540(+)
MQQVEEVQGLLLHIVESLANDAAPAAGLRDRHVRDLHQLDLKDVVGMLLLVSLSGQRVAPQHAARRLVLLEDPVLCQECMWQQPGEEARRQVLLPLALGLFPDRALGLLDLRLVVTGLSVRPLVGVVQGVGLASARPAVACSVLVADHHPRQHHARGALRRFQLRRARLVPAPVWPGLVAVRRRGLRLGQRVARVGGVLKGAVVLPAVA